MGENKIFSKQAIELLKDNGYNFKKKDHIVSFRHYSGDRIGLVLIGLFLFLASFVLLVKGNVPLWAGSVGLLITALVIIWRRMTDKSLLMFDLKDKTFFHKKNGSSIWLPLNNISDITLKSRPTGGTPLDDTDEDHQITICLVLESNKKMVLFKFHSYFQQPSIQIKEIYNWVETTAGKTHSIEGESWIVE